MRSYRFCASPDSAGMMPGSMNIAIIGGTSRLAIRLSRTTGTRTLLPA
jgi:hypothetical protein